MARNYSTYTLRASQSPVHSYNKDGKTVTEGYDLGNAKYWYRVDFGRVHEFNSQREMEQARDREFSPSTPDLSLPQLPARALAYSFDARVDRNLRRNRLAFRQNHPMRYPTRGVVALPAPGQTQPAPQHTPAQAKAIADFLSEAETYFKLFSQAVNGNMKEFNLQRGQWKLRNAELAAGQAASKYAQFVGMGI